MNVDLSEYNKSCILSHFWCPSHKTQNDCPPLRVSPYYSSQQYWMHSLKSTNIAVLSKNLSNPWSSLLDPSQLLYSVAESSTSDLHLKASLWIMFVVAYLLYFLFHSLLFRLVPILVYFFPLYFSVLGCSLS